ncbi:MAG: hypothetical protein FWH26_03740, partial [Oscillospiraceae bacterium]|nr:hypothetical protein [Oscillospiraceae bacterium]
YAREATERALFFRLKEALVYIADSLKHKPLEFSALEAPAHDWLHPVNSAAVSLDGQALGLISVLHPRVRGQLDLVNRKAPIEKKAAVAVAELDMDAFAEIPAANFRYAAPSSYPSVAIDLSLVLNEEDTYGKIEGILQSVGCETLQSAALADYYEAGGETSLAIRLTFVSGGRSLLMDEVQEDVARIVEALGKAGIARKGV